jgi:hypothetical protein
VRISRWAKLNFSMEIAFSSLDGTATLDFVGVHDPLSRP